MKAIFMIRILFNFLIFFFLVSCSANPGTAFLGPVFTGVKTGSIYQTSLSYTSNKVFEDFKEELKSKKNDVSNKSKSIINNLNNILKDPPLLTSLKIDTIVISEIVEPEPLP